MHFWGLARVRFLFYLNLYENIYMFTFKKKHTSEPPARSETRFGILIEFLAIGAFLKKKKLRVEFRDSTDWHSYRNHNNYLDFYSRSNRGYFCAYANDSGLAHSLHVSSRRFFHDRGYGGHTLRSLIDASLITREVSPETYFLLVIMAAIAKAGPFLQFQASCLRGTL
jgi:hypothetical protein